MMRADKFHSWELVWANIKYRRFQHLVIFLIVFAGCFALSIGSVLNRSMASGAGSLKERVGADIIVAPKGYGDISENALLDGEPCTLTMSAWFEDLIRELPGVTDVSSRLYFATMEGASCCAGKTQLIVADLEHDFLLRSLTDGIELGKNELLAGSGHLLKPGDTILYFNREFTVKAVLPETGTGYDESCFISKETAKEITQDPMYVDILFGIDPEENTSMIFLNTADTAQTMKDLEELFLQYPGIEWFSFHDYMDDVDRNVDDGVTIVAIFETILLLVCLLSLFCLFAVFLGGRRHEIGSLRLLHMRGWKIFLLLFAESAAVTIFGAACGSVLCYVLAGQFKALAASVLTVPLLYPDISECATAFLKTGGVFMAAVFAALLAVFCDLMRRPASDLLKGGD